MVVGAISSRTELAIIGAGPGGYVAALRAADAGLEVTLIERDEPGGTCLNVGCVPSKTLIEVAIVRHRAITAGPTGLTATIDLDIDQLNRHVQGVTARLRTGVTQLLDAAGVTVIHGDASFARYDRLSIAAGDTVSHLEFDNAILATGSRPVQLPNIAFGPDVVTSTGALNLTRLPNYMAVIGGGYIGIELGTAWAKLGVDVTIIEAGSSILADLPAALRQPVERRLDKLGVTVCTSTTVESVADRVLTLSSGQQIKVDVTVVAVGRWPNSDQASIDTLDIELADSGHIVVDSQMRAATGIYAIGDLVAGPALAHKATAEAELAVAAILGHSTMALGVVPAVIFSDPEIISVGVGLDEAPGMGLGVHRFPHAASARAHSIDDATGSTYVVADESGTILGIHATGPHVSELAGEAALAIELAATVEDLSLTIHPHPTMSESLAEAAWLARGHPLHIRR